MKHSLWSLSLLVFASACLKDTSAPAEEIPPISKIALTPGSVSLVVGKAATFSVAVTGGTGKEPRTWSFSDAAVGSVSSTGTFSARGSGFGELKVQVDTFTASAIVTVTPAGITLTPGSVTLPVGQTIQLNAAVLDGTGQTTGLLWSFSKDAVGLLTNSGFFTARGTGTGTVTVSAPGGLQATATISVTPSAISVSPASTSIQVGKTAQFRASVSDGTGTPSTVTWSVSDPSVGTLSSTGLFTATGSGDAVITGSVASGAVSATASVKVSPTSVVVTPGTAVLTIGSSLQFAAAVSDGTGAASVVTWSFSDPLIGSVTSGGLFTAKGTGFGTLFASASGLTASAALSVTPTGIKITRGSDTLMVGRTQQYFADVNDGTGRASTVRWSFSNLNVATIGESGILTPTAAGTGKVTATAGGATNSVDLLVTSGSVDRLSVCDRASGSCASSATLSITGSVVSVRASAFNSLGADISSTCSFAWTAQKENIVTISLSNGGRDALVTRVNAGSVSILVSCSGQNAVFNIG